MGWDGSFWEGRFRFLVCNKLGLERAVQRRRNTGSGVTSALLRRGSLKGTGLLLDWIQKTIHPN